MSDPRLDPDFEWGEEDMGAWDAMRDRLSDLDIDPLDTYWETT